MKIFLGGTCADSTWRDNLIPLLDNGKIDYFNPVVEDWTEKAQEEEERQKWEECDVHLYLITPEMKGFFSLIEIMDSIAQGILTFFIFYRDGWDEAQLKSMVAIEKLLKKRYETQCVVINKRFEKEALTEAIRILNILNKDE